MADRAVAKSELIDDALVNEALADSATKTLGLDPAAKPMNISVEVDTGKGVRELIGPDGGILTVNGADSTKFTLEIPKEAVLRDTLIEMTPVTSLSGLPFNGGLVGAVRLQPDGLILAVPAVLSIEPAQLVPPNDQIAFGAGSDGRDVHLLPLALRTHQARLQIPHFSTGGSVNPAPGAIEFEGGSIKWTEGYWPAPEKPLDRYWQEIAKALAEKQILDKSKYDPDSPIYQEAVKRGDDRVRAARFLYFQDLARRLKAAGADCSKPEEVDKVQSEYYASQRQARIVLEEGTESTPFDALLSAVVKKCAKEALELCRAGELRGSEHMGMFQRMHQITGSGDAYTDEEWGERKKCRPKGWSGIISWRRTENSVIQRGSTGSGRKLEQATITIREKGIGRWQATRTGSYDVKRSKCRTQISEQYSGKGPAVLSVTGVNEPRTESAPPESDAMRIDLNIQPDGNYSLNFNLPLEGSSRSINTGPLNECEVWDETDKEPASIDGGVQGQGSPEPDQLSGSSTVPLMAVDRKVGDVTITWTLTRGQ